MATEAARQIMPSAVEATGISVTSSTRSAAHPRQGTLYTQGGLSAAVPVWFHPLPSGRHLAILSRRVSGGVTSTAPSWAVVDPTTGALASLAEIPSRIVTTRTLTAAVGQGNYLFLLSQTPGGAALLQHFQTSADGGLSLLGEEFVPGDLGLGLYVGTPHLWVFGTKSGHLAVARKSWARVGTSKDRDPAMNWQYRTAQGWSSTQDDLVALPGEIPADGPCSVAALRNKFLLIATSLSSGSYTARGYSSRALDTTWSPTSFSLALGAESDYLGTTARLQPQLPLTAGWATTPTAGAETRLDDHSDPIQVFTGYAPHTVVLPPTVTTLTPITLYNQSTSTLTVLASDHTALPVLTTRAAATYTPTGLTTTGASAWTPAAISTQTLTPRSGFSYLTTVVESGAWRTSWGIVEV